MKVCTKCKAEKDEHEFYKSNVSKDGLHVYCKQCCKKVNDSYYLKNTQEIKENRKINYDKLNYKRRVLYQTNLYYRTCIKSKVNNNVYKLTDVYIKYLIKSRTKNNIGKIPPEIINQLRTLLKIKRTIKNITI